MAHSDLFALPDCRPVNTENGTDTCPSVLSEHVCLSLTSFAQALATGLSLHHKFAVDAAASLIAREDRCPLRWAASRCDLRPATSAYRSFSGGGVATAGKPSDPTGFSERARQGGWMSSRDLHVALFSANSMTQFL